ncbi:MAG: class I SAM-dependent methyltransferase [Bacteroidota bacterium]
MQKTIKDVKNFWENNPLFSGESDFKVGSKEFFEDHKKTYYNDVFAGNFDDSLFIPKNLEKATVLDLGCGVGFWTIEIQQRRKCKAFYSCDITQKAIDITKKRLEIYGPTANLSIQNAETLSYENGFFDHVNCQGVIHHTPNTDKAIQEIARILIKGGTASISVYYRNFLLRNWPNFSYIGKLISKLGGGLKGRGRESILNIKNIDEITRLYDGENNPIGKSYTKIKIMQMLTPFFEIERSFCFFFPARALPIKIPKPFHRFLAKNMGFMLHLNLIKK